ncbi:ribosomal protein P0 (A0) (L10E) [Physocladia obscura]|uniref:60S acidic ribosomal protein P0 n=1 Tax=Physocladia obscura TaxID=109957 RepID=A0AAD5TAN7_9FUNG|nr:ribosomal protein P0 (A0) (L10E) [Physocladia obscura]
MSKGDGRSKKAAYFAKLETLLQEYPSIFIVNVDNVGSNQMHQIRLALRGVGVILMGKNTMVRKVLRGLIIDNPDLTKLMEVVRGNVGFVFTKGDLKDVRSKILSNRVAAPAKAGALAPIDVFVPAGNTGMEPGKTSFFQALGVPTKIARGTIEIVSDVHLIKKDTRVGASEAALLNMLNISPFTYGLTVTHVWDSNTLFSPDVLDVDPEVYITNLIKGISNVAAVSLATGIPTAASVPHLLINGFKNVLSVGLETEYSFTEGDRIKEALKNPIASAPVAASASAPAAGSAPVAVAAKEEEKEESEDDDMGFGLFD